MHEHVRARLALDAAGRDQLEVRPSTPALDAPDVDRYSYVVTIYSNYIVAGSDAERNWVRLMGYRRACENTGLWLTVPRMARVRDLPVLSGPASDEAALAESALRVEGTGLPWQEEANVYIAGHRVGFEGEASHLVFYDLDILQNGDEVILSDSDDTRYTYRVFASFVVGPSDYYVTEPLPGKNVVSLQTCTPLPTFEERLVVQAELADVD